MAQWLKALGVKGGGIIAVLFVIGFTLRITNLNEELGNLALWAAVIIGIIYALLGVVGIILKYLK